MLGRPGCLSRTLGTAPAGINGDDSVGVNTGGGGGGPGVKGTLEGVKIGGVDGIFGVFGGLGRPVKAACPVIRPLRLGLGGVSNSGVGGGRLVSRHNRRPQYGCVYWRSASARAASAAARANSASVTASR